jgi:hypothetical protein
MTVKPKNIKYVPLFEEHKAINERFAALPDQMKADLAKILSIDEDAILCGSMGMYLTGMQSEMPNGIDVIVSDASKILECGMGDNLDYPPQPQAQAQGQAQTIDAQPGEIVVITVTPQGEVSSMEEPHEEAPQGEYDDQGNFHFEGFKWFNGRPAGVQCDCNIFECRKNIKSMPLALGNITVLVEDPGVMSEYRKKFAKVKGKVTKAKYEKSPGYDKAKKQGHVTKENELQDTPEK